MPKRTLMEESQLLHYAFVITELVGVISRYVRDKHLLKQDRDILDKSLEFINRAIDGQSLLSKVENKMAPDIESLEIYGYVTSALDNEEFNENDLDETLKERLSNSSATLQLLKENNFPENELHKLEKMQSFFRSVAAVLVHESMVFYQEEDRDNLS